MGVIWISIVTGLIVNVLAHDVYLLIEIGYSCINSIECHVTSFLEKC